MILSQSSSPVKSIESRDEAFYRELLAVSKVPEQLHDGLIRYLVDGHPPGSFLRFVLEDSAAAAIRRADNDCRAAIGEVFVFLINVAPWASWGSVGAVAQWMADRQQEQAVTA